MNFIVAGIALLSTMWIARLITEANHILLAPALTLSLWACVLAISVGFNLPIELIWLPFWMTILASAAASAIASYYSWTELHKLIVPAICTIVILLPYFLHGVSDYPGSHLFWDGYAYVAEGESLWPYPRSTGFESLPMFYKYGIMMAQGRYVGSSLLSIFRGVIPLGGDTQQAAAYFFVLCVFTLACSSAFLASILWPNHLAARFLFVALVTVSCPTLNLVWANNIDHILALALAPALTGLAFRNRDEFIESCVMGIMGAAIVFIYPEMAPILILPAAVLSVSQVISRRSRAIPLAVTMIVAIALLAPFLYEISRFFSGQITATQTAIRPGEGMYGALLRPLCAPAAFAGLYSNSQQCFLRFDDLFRLVIGCSFLGAALMGAAKMRNWIAISVAIVSAGAIYFLLVQNYSYGAFKLLSSNFYLLAALVVAFGVSIQVQTAKILFSLIVGAYVVNAITRVDAFDRQVAIKSIEPYRAIKIPIPLGAVVGLDIVDNVFAFEWAAYYLRVHPVVPIHGELPYYPLSEESRRAFERSHGPPSFLLTTDIRDLKLTWSNEVYRLYSLDRQ